MKKFISFICFCLFLYTYSTAQSLCATDSTLHIVVLGSSTAQGAGANPSDSAWVNLFRSHLQDLNPDNSVTNLAQGGYNTYRLLPTNSTPPAGRPLPDSTKNISRAIALMPDAIIVNLPSNDVSSGYSVEEQLNNFETIVGVANGANIPIWICTTQPKNYGGNPIPIQKQVDVRDSIIARYSPNVLDFWSGLAGPDNQIDPFYDSGDGTHLNNAGHSLLFTRARDANIPNQLVAPLNYVDYVIYDVEATIAPTCGVGTSTFIVSIFNRGLDDTSDVPVELEVEQVGSGQSTTYRDTIIGGLLHCEETFFSFMINSEDAGDYIFTTLITPVIDGNANNNMMVQQETFEGVPYLNGMGGTVCVDESLLLQADAAAGDSIHWYDTANGGNLLGTGPTYQTPPLSNTTNYYAEAFRGNFVENKSIFTNDVFDRDWNGFMFDLVADEALLLDSFEFKMDTFGLHLVDIYSRAGSHLGYELDASAWNYTGTYPINVDGPTEWSAIDLGGIPMDAGDSLAIYIQLQNPVNTMFYLLVPEPITRGTDELTLYSGTGISHNFSERYFPRDWNGSVYYHFDKPNGDCSTGRVAVEATVSMPIIDLGTDQVIFTSESILLDVGSGFSNIEWSDGSMGQTLLIDGQTYGPGTYQIEVSGTDEFGCQAVDIIQITINPSVGTKNINSSELKIWPNPVDDYLHFEYPAGQWQLQLRDQWGRLVFQNSFVGAQENVKKIATANWVPGLYFLEMTARNGQKLRQKVVIAR